MTAQKVHCHRQDQTRVSGATSDRAKSDDQDLASAVERGLCAIDTPRQQISIVIEAFLATKQGK
jgi:hypothetical protein